MLEKVAATKITACYTGNDCTSETLTHIFDFLCADY